MDVDAMTATGPVRLADLIEQRKLLWVYCRDCGRERDLDPAALLLPPDWPVPDVGKRMVCSACGSRKVTTAPELCHGGVAAERARRRANADG